MERRFQNRLRDRFRDRFPNGRFLVPHVEQRAEQRVSVFFRQDCRVVTLSLARKARLQPVDLVVAVRAV